MTRKSEEWENWIESKHPPPTNTLVIARNPHCESISWIDGINEVGKISWSHFGWEHADDYVTEWRHIRAGELVMYNGKISIRSENG